MTDRIPWIEREFNFDFPAALHHEMLERLRGTPARAEDLVRQLPPAILTKRDGNPWSIQDNVGHLTDAEDMFMKRLDDYEAGADTLRPADMSNQKTDHARHNDNSIDSVLSNLRRERFRLVDRLERLDPGRFAQAAMHARLNKPMRIVDMMYFMAEHDDYHLARITELAKTLTR